MSLIKGASLSGLSVIARIDIPMACAISKIFDFHFRFVTAHTKNNFG